MDAASAELFDDLTDLVAALKDPFVKRGQSGAFVRLVIKLFVRQLILERVLLNYTDLIDPAAVEAAAEEATNAFKAMWLAAGDTPFGTA